MQLIVQHTRVGSFLALTLLGMRGEGFAVTTLDEAKFTKQRESAQGENYATS